MAIDADHASQVAAFRRGAQLYSQPVAIALGRLVRCKTPQERVDASLKAAEVLTRYLAAVCLASFAARDDAVTDDLTVGPLSGNLSFGHFLSLVQRVSAFGSVHPVAPFLSPFRPQHKGDVRGPGAADAALSALLTLRNDLGHDLANMSEARARTVLTEHKPEARLAEAVAALERMLGLPLFLVEDQRIGKGQIVGRRMWLMGESRDPEPEEVPQDGALHDVGAPCVAVGERVLVLRPMMTWAILPARETYGLLFADKIKAAGIQYRSLDPVDLHLNGDAVTEMESMCAGGARPADKLLVRGGRSVATEWTDERKRREAAVDVLGGAMPWSDFESDTLQWYADRLAGEPVVDVRAVLTERLLDGRDRFAPSEMRQAILLFGTDHAVRQALRRETVDLRALGVDEVRWLERQQGHSNVVTSLRVAVGFFARHENVAGASLDGLTSTGGSADYLAMREALVNLFIHQDYDDASAAAQVELRPEMAIFFNTGYSLVAEERLVEGGKSQSRNPLIARALRLIGFAELAGSGIRSLQIAWRQAQRRPPRFESDRQANTFSVRLDWRRVPAMFDAFWKAKIGVALTTDQARLLELAFDPAGINAAQAAAGTGLSVDDARESLRYLVRQVLLREDDGRYFVADHLREIAG